MINEVHISGYRKFRDLWFKPRNETNIFVGDNESGKSTILEAIGLCLTSKVNGRPAIEELNPYWFNQDLVAEFFRARAEGKQSAPPSILIEVFFTDTDPVQQFKGAHSSKRPIEACPGFSLSVEPSSEY